MRAKQLRDEAFRDMWRGLWALLTKVVGDGNAFRSLVIAKD